MGTVSADLRPHPTTPRTGIRTLAATVGTSPGGEFVFEYRVEGNLGRLRLPLPGTARRRDNLWQHSCFEAFLRPDANDSYYELNFAPSGDWAAYRFRSRRGARSSPEMPAPRIDVQRSTDAFVLSAAVPHAALPGLAGGRTLHAALTAVIEAEDGVLSYWALAHGSDKPDFHDPATFTLRVPRG